MFKSMNKLVFSKNFNILTELTRKSVKTNYRNSFFGMLWTVLNPLLNMFVMLVIFSQFFGKNDPLYPIYLLTGNIIFQTFRSATENSMLSIVNNKGLISKININKYLFPLSNVCSSFVTFIFSLASMLVIMIIMSIVNHFNLFGYQMIFIILFLPAFLIFCYGIGLFLSALYVFFRDIKHLYAVLLTLWMYITPIFYKETTFATSSIAYHVIKLNPLYYFLKYFRECIYSIHASGINFMPSWKILGLLYVLALISISIGFLLFKKLKRHFMMYI